MIPHEFVLLEPLPYEVDSAEEAFKLVWPHVKDAFTRDWDQPKPRALSRSRERVVWDQQRWSQRQLDDELGLAVPP